VQGDPAGVAPHDLDHHDPFVGAGGGVQLVDRVGRGHDGGVEAERGQRRGEVVVDGLRHADHRHAQLGEARGEPEAAVATDRDQHVEPETPEALHHPVRHVVVAQFLAMHLDRVAERIAAVRRAEDGPAERGDARHPLGREPHDLAGVEQPRVAGLDAVHLPVAAGGGEGHGLDDRVQAGRIAATGVDGDPLAAHALAPSSPRIHSE
jgi:hypothetical protein